MVRRFLSCVVLAACAGAGGLLAAERATLILGDGQRISGAVVSRGDSRSRDGETYRRGDLTLRTDDGREIPIRLDQVAVIQFGSGWPGFKEFDALHDNAQYDNAQMMVRRNGSIESGRFIDITDNGVRWQAANGRQEMIPFRELTRIYLNADRARIAFNESDHSDPDFRDRYDRRDGNRSRNAPDVRNGSTGAIGTSGAGRYAADVRVDADRAWSSTGIDVRAGDFVTFRASGRINFGQGSTQNAGPDGNESLRSPAYPVGVMPVGGLIGRVGNSAPFPIGSNTQPIRMPANGTLLLGVNDDSVSDNSGFFTVAVTRQ